MFFLWALLCLGAPSYFNAAGDQRTAWFGFGAAVAMIGFLGALVELSKVPGREALSDFAAALTLAVFTAALGAPPVVWYVPSPFSGILKGLAFLFALLTGLGIAAGIGRLVSSRSKRPHPEVRRSKTSLVISAVVGASALATAGLNLGAALAGKK